MNHQKKFLYLLVGSVLLFNCLIVLFPELMPTKNFVFRFIGMMDTPGIGLYEVFKGEASGNNMSIQNKMFKIGIMTIGTSVFWVIIRNIIIVIKSRSSLG